ncbi:MAG: alkaline phosphatase D family protein [Pseudonocardia sp.]
MVAGGAAGQARLLLGPVLRHVGETTASVWVQVDSSATVTVLGCSAQTFEVAGHHYALVGVTGLEPGSTTPYEVHVDGEKVWPPPVSPFPPSIVRTRGGTTTGHARLVFGSCRYPKVADPGAAARLGIDALDAYAARMARRPVDEWPDVLVLLGDQVYADELTPQNRRRIGGKRDRHPDWPADEIVGFDEYAGLYADSWSDPEVRWMMSTVAVAMIFDDHDIRDDWNTSQAWREQMAAMPWWRDRIRAGLASYWVYQHIGNLAPEHLAADRDHAAVVGHGGDTWQLLAELADRADAENCGVKGVRFSYRWNLGDTRLVMIDSRNGRILADGAHLMLGDTEFRWVEEQVFAPGRVDHLVLGTSLPWLLPPAIGDVQGINEVAAARPGWRGRLGEAIRQAADLEHWAAFDESFDRLTRLITRAAAAGPATVTVLSGDVHHSYAARATLPGDPPAAVHQLTCSPVHNHVDWFLRPGFRLGWSRVAARLTRAWSRHVGVADPEVSWRRVAGPLFGNIVATLAVAGRTARVTFEQPRTAATLDELAALQLTAQPADTPAEVP